MRRRRARTAAERKAHLRAIAEQKAHFRAIAERANGWRDRLCALADAVLASPHATDKQRDLASTLKVRCNALDKYEASGDVRQAAYASAQATAIAEHLTRRAACWRGCYVTEIDALPQCMLAVLRERDAIDEAELAWIVWGDETVSPNRIKQAVAKLNRRLQASGCSHVICRERSVVQVI